MSNNRDVLNRIAASLEDISRDRRVRARTEEPKKVVSRKVFYDIWWSGDLSYGKLSRYVEREEVPNRGWVFVNGEKTSEQLHEVLNRLQGTVVAYSQAAYNGVHTRSYTVEVTVEEEEKN